MIGQARVQMRRREASGGEATAGEERFTTVLRAAKTRHLGAAPPVTQPPRAGAGRRQSSGDGSEAVADAGGDQVDLEVVTTLTQVVALEFGTEDELIDLVLGTNAIERVDTVFPVRERNIPNKSVCPYINISIPCDQPQLAIDTESILDWQLANESEPKTFYADV